MNNMFTTIHVSITISLSPVVFSETVQVTNRCSTIHILQYFCANKKILEMVYHNLCRQNLFQVCNL